MNTIDIDIELDNKLFGDVAEIDFADGYTFKGFWLLSHVLCWAAAQLKQTHPDVPNVDIVRMRCGSTAHKILTGTSLVVEETKEDDAIAPSV